MRSVLISGILVGAFSLNAAWAVDVQSSEHNLRPVTQLADIIPVRRPVRADIIPVRPPVPAQLADIIPVRPPVPAALA
jgi:hypothetical protein